jgi:hypothetical protein
MKTDCNPNQIEFEGMGRRQVVATFEGDHVTSDGGLLLLREVAERTGVLEKFAECFDDHRDPTRIEHTTLELISQRVLGIICGYEDLSDHATLRDDPLFAAAAGKKDIEGKSRRSAKDEGHALASPSTLNRLELTPSDADATARYRKIVYNDDAIADFFVQTFLDAHDKPPKSIVLDLDATDDPLHGKQEGRFFHGYYGHYCYLPLYIFCGDFLLCAKIRQADCDASAGAREEVERIVARIRERWPEVEIILRADSGFARDDLMNWAEKNDVDFVFGLAQNKRLKTIIADDMERVKSKHEDTGAPEREFCDFSYRTLNSWSCERRVVAKVEHLPDKANPRFVVTSLGMDRFDARALYEDFYCARGDMENRIKEQQLWLFADRTSAHTMRANQLRLYFASVAYVLLNLLRFFGLRDTEMARAQAGTIRTKLLKIGAVITVSVRRLVVKISRYSPVKDLFARILANLRERIPVPG